MAKNQVLSNSSSRLTFIEDVGRNNSNKPLARYQCACGNVIIAIVPNVNSGKSKSCGCLRAELLAINKPGTKHGLAKTPLYDVWHLMMRRCYEVGSKNYHQYGGLGVTVCKEWHNVAVFNDWCKANGWAPGLQIDRYPDKAGIYEPSNCRFVTSKVNNNNRRDNRVIEFNGDSKTLQEWSDSIGINKATIRMRIDKLKWPVEKALTKPLR